MTIAPDPRDVDGFTAFMARYKKGLVIERAAVDGLSIKDAGTTERTGISGKSAAPQARSGYLHLG